MTMDLLAIERCEDEGIIDGPFSRRDGPPLVPNSVRFIFTSKPISRFVSLIFKRMWPRKIVQSTL